MSSFRLSVSPKRRAAARFLGQVRQSLQKALAENPEISQSTVARALETDRSVISKQLNGEQNLSLGRVAEIAWALGQEPEFRLKTVARPFGRNEAVVVPAENSTIQAPRAETPDYFVRASPSKAVSGSRVELEPAG